jgi:hypothetical protein
VNGLRDLPHFNFYRHTVSQQVVDSPVVSIKAAILVVRLGG